MLITSFFTKILQAGELRVIVSKDSPLTKVSLKKLKTIFQKNSDRIGSLKVVPIQYSFRTQMRKDFCKDVLRISVKKSKKFWISQQVKGIRKPKTKKSFRSMAIYLKKHPEAIANTYEKKVPKSLKV